MSVGGVAARLLGDYFYVNYAGQGLDDHAIFRAFVDEGKLRRTFDAAEEIESWLHLNLSDDAFIEFFQRVPAFCGPRNGELRDYLRDVRVYLLTYADKKIQRALAENSQLPASYVRAVMMSTDYGDEWLRSIPALLESARSRLGVTIGTPYPLNSDYLAPATTVAGEPVVLRLGKGGFIAPRAMACLRTYAGKGAVRVIDEAPEEGMVLLERAIPGRPLSEIVEKDDQVATEVIATVLETLWRKVPADQVSNGELGNWRRPYGGLEPIYSEFDKYDSLFAYRKLVPAHLLRDAHHVMRELLDSAPRGLLLHGDLHHDNIVSSDRSPTGWLAIDPKGYHGDPAYDVAAMFYNPLPWVAQVSDLEGLLRSRTGQIAARLRMDEERIKAWAFVKAVLSEIWFIQDTGTTHGVPLRVAATLRAMI